MKQFILFIAFILLVCIPKLVFAQVPSTQTTTTVTSVVSNLLNWDMGRAGWCIEVEGTSGIRIAVGDLSGNAPRITPTSSVGWLIPGGSTLCSYISGLNATDPRPLVQAISTSGTVTVDIWRTYKNYDLVKFKTKQSATNK